MDSQHNAHCYLIFGTETWHIHSIEDILFHVSFHVSRISSNTIQYRTVIWPKHMWPHYVEIRVKALEKEPK